MVRRQSLLFILYSFNKRRKKNVNSSDLLTQLGAFNNEGGIENEIGIIRSRLLISKTIEELQLYKSYYLIGDVKTSEIFALKPFDLKKTPYITLPLIHLSN